MERLSSLFYSIKKWLFPAISVSRHDFNNDTPKSRDF